MILYRSFAPVFPAIAGASSLLGIAFVSCPQGSRAMSVVVCWVCLVFGLLQLWGQMQYEGQRLYFQGTAQYKLAGFNNSLYSRASVFSSLNGDDKEASLSHRLLWIWRGLKCKNVYESHLQIQWFTVMWIFLFSFFPSLPPKVMEPLSHCWLYQPFPCLVAAVFPWGLSLVFSLCSLVFSPGPLHVPLTLSCRDSRKSLGD